MAVFSAAMTQDQLDAARAAAQTVRLYTLYTSAKQEIATARKMARSGQKEQARLVYSFLNRSSICDIIKTHEFPGLSVDAAHLAWELDQLRLECHPDHAPVVIGDLNRIAASLEAIASGVAQNLDLQNKLVRALAAGGAK